MMNLFSNKKGRAAKTAKKAAKQAEEDGKPNWPSLSPAPSFPAGYADQKVQQPEGGGLADTQSLELITSFVPPLHLQALSLHACPASVAGKQQYSMHQSQLCRLKSCRNLVESCKRMWLLQGPTSPEAVAEDDDFSVLPTPLNYPCPVEHGNVDNVSLTSNAVAELDGEMPALTLSPCTPPSPSPAGC